MPPEISPPTPRHPELRVTGDFGAKGARTGVSAMSHYITVPINENGIIFDTDMVAVVQEAIAVSPFGFDDVYVYSHGWSTDAYRALDLYNKLSEPMVYVALAALECARSSGEYSSTV